MSVTAIYDKNTWEAVNLLQTYTHWQGHFGVFLKSKNGEHSVAVDTVEHARIVIAALEKACTDGTLYTEAQLAEFHTHASDTRRSIDERIQMHMSRDNKAG